MVCEDYTLTEKPGWEKGSVGYHIDDGKIYHNDSSGKETEGLENGVNKKIVTDLV